MDYQRKLNLSDLLKKKSFFLLGPRSTGKSTLIQQQLKKQSFVIDLLESDYSLRLSTRPQDLEDLIGPIPKEKIIVIDEVQKIPPLLDEVHRLIEKQKRRFLLTGSSARKLKGQAANLLGGRAWVAHLYPLSWSELPRFSLESHLLYGGLPPVKLSRYPQEELRAYVHTYLYEEIRAEAVVRKIPAFSRFLEVAALSNGQLINFTEIASDCAVPASTVREYYTVLEDTLLGFELAPWTKSKKRKAIQTAKFYFFDLGVTHHLAGIHHLDRNSDPYGRAFEHFIGLELQAYLGYSRRLEEIKFWRSVNGQEVDYVIGDHTAIEVKATQKVSERHLKGLKAIAEETKFKNKILVSQDRLSQTKGGILCLPWEAFLERLWGGKLLD